MHKRPPIILFITALYVLSPAINLSQVMLLDEYTWEQTRLAYGFYGLAFLAGSPLVGVGIYAARPWGMVLFVVYSVVGIGYNLDAWLNTEQGSVGGLVINLAAVVFVAMVMNKTNRAPYFSKLARGWRRNDRLSCEVPTELHTSDGKLNVTARNYSKTGALLHGEHSGLELGDEIHVNFQFDGETKSTKAHVRRVEKGSLGIAFHHEADHERDHLERSFRSSAQPSNKNQRQDNEDE